MAYYVQRTTNEVKEDMNRRQERIAGFIATCSGVLAGSLAGGMVGSLLAVTLFPDSPASGFSPGLIVAYVCVLIGAMLCCWMTLKAIRHPLATRTTALLLVFLPLTALGMASLDFADLGSTLAVYLFVAVALCIASSVAHLTAIRFSRHRV